MTRNRWGIPKRKHEYKDIWWYVFELMGWFMSKVVKVREGR